MFRVLLCIPPNYCFTYNFPPLGTPTLAGYLKQRGIEVVQADYNMAYLDYWKKKILTNPELQRIPASESTVITRELLNNVFKQKLNKGYYYSSFLSTESTGIVYHDNTNSSFSFVERMLSSEYLFRYIEDKKENTFLQFFNDESILSKIERQNINLVGVSIIAPSQVLGAFTLGYLIKKNLPHIHVTIGGQWATLYREELKKMAQWMRLFDSIIFFEGETPLYNLAINLYKNKDLSDVPNLIFHSGELWVESKISSKENLDDISCPDFDGLPFKNYHVSLQRGHIALTYQTARECYWNRCAYCVDLPLPKQGYRERNIELVTDDIKELIKKYNMSFLEISNAAISPIQMKKLSESILRTGLNFSWWCFARLDENFTKDLFELSKRAGCEIVAFGLESGNQRVLDFVKKGVNIETARRVIIDCHSAGIEIHLQVMMGLPSETTQEALDTVKFLIEHREYIASVTFNVYYLTPACEIYQNPLQYGIDYKRYPDLPFKFFHEYRHLSGELSQKKSDSLINLYGQLLFKKENIRNNTESAGILKLNSNITEHNLCLAVGDDVASIVYRFDKEKRTGAITDNVEEKTNA